MTITTNAKTASVASTSGLIETTEPKFSDHIQYRTFQCSMSIPALPAWTATRQNIAADLLARQYAAARPMTYETTTLSDGAIFTVFRADDGDFFETVGGNVPTVGRKYRMEARNHQAAISILLPHLEDTCETCNGYGGDWDGDCEDCDRTGARRGTETYTRRIARREEARRYAERHPLPF